MNETKDYDYFVAKSGISGNWALRVNEGCTRQMISWRFEEKGGCKSVVR